VDLNIKKMVNIQHKINELLTNNKALFLALDQGLEHGPKDFNLTTINPEYVFNLARDEKFNAIILQKGLAIRYHENYRYKIPLILKLNGKTGLGHREPYSPQICSVKKAVKLGADAVGYTIYFGSPYEPEMFKEFSKIEEEAHDYGLPVVLWAYPRGSGVEESSTDTLAYAARASLELGADFIKIKYNGDSEGYKWIVKSSGNSKLFAAGGEKKDVKDFLSDVYNVMKAGASGVAIGRNVWQSEHPLKISDAVKAIVFGNKTVEQALKLIKK